MNQDQQVVAWIAIIGLIIGIWLVYRAELSAIIFNAPTKASSSGSVGTVPIPNNGDDPEGDTETPDPIVIE